MGALFAFLYTMNLDLAGPKEILSAGLDSDLKVQADRLFGEFV